jgi:hypothetical protein
MDKGIVVPLALFFSVVYALKLLVDARLRYLFWKGGSTPETVAALFAAEDRVRRLGALRTGLVALALGVGLGVIDATGTAPISAAGLAMLLVALGLGNLFAFAGTEWLARGRGGSGNDPAA